MLGGMDGERMVRWGAKVPGDRQVRLSLEEVYAVQAAVTLAGEALASALYALGDVGDTDSPITRDIGFALEALATTEDDLRRVTAARTEAIVR